MLQGAVAVLVFQKSPAMACPYNQQGAHRGAARGNRRGGPCSRPYEVLNRKIPRSQMASELPQPQDPPVARGIGDLLTAGSPGRDLPCLRFEFAEDPLATPLPAVRVRGGPPRDSPYLRFEFAEDSLATPLTCGSSSRRTRSRAPTR